MYSILPDRGAAARYGERMRELIREQLELAQVVVQPMYVNNELLSPTFANFDCY